MDTKQMLDQLAELQSKLDVLNMREQEIRDSIVPAEVKKQLDDLKSEFDGQRLACQENINELREAIVSEIKSNGTSVKGARLHAIFVKGRVTWDSKGVEGFALAHPELMAYRKEGEPSVSFRSI